MTHDEATPQMTDEELLAALDHDEGYRVIRELGHGETGTTELVRRCGGAGANGAGGSGARPGELPAGGRLLVRKRIPAALANRRAWEAARTCDEPLLARVRDIYELPDQLVVVYDYVPGEPLSKLVGDAQGLDPASACAVALDVCRAVGALHRAGVVHRDVTPSNVIVSVDGAHLIDLGIARLADPRTGADGDARASRDTTTLGTTGFAAPEQYGFARTDARADVYSIGRLVAWMLAGGFGEDGTADAALAGLDQAAPALAAVVRKACSFDRDARYGSADELARALRQAIPDAAAGRDATGRDRAVGEPVGAAERQRSGATPAGASPQSVAFVEGASSEDAPAGGASGRGESTEGMPAEGAPGRDAPAGGSIAEGSPAEAEPEQAAPRRARRRRGTGAPRSLGVVSPSDLVGSLRSAGVTRILLALAFTLTLGLAWSIHMLGVAADDLAKADGLADRVFMATICVSFGVAWVYATFLEVPGAILHAGPYCGEAHPVRRALRRCAAAFLLALAVVVVLRTVQLNMGG
ncbi:MAG: protein kinase [Coriobacteriales bacterium]|jgi:hypothetical protein